MRLGRARTVGNGARLRGALGLACLTLAGLACTGLSGPNLSADVKAAYATLSLDLESRFQTRAPAPETRIFLGPGGRDVRLSGEIAEGAADRLGRLLDAHPAVERIHLTSEGGLVDEAEAIGARIAARGLTTYVPDYCVSACTLAFVRGRERLLVTGGRLGFHAPYDPGLFGQVFQADSEAERRSYVAAGVDDAFVSEALRVASDDLWIPEAERLVAARVVTGLVDTHRFPDSTLDDDAGPAAVRAAVLRNLPLLAGFETAPGLIDRIGAWYLDAYRTGHSEGEAFDGLRRLAAEEVTRAARGADHSAIVALGRYLHGAMQAAPASVCVRLGENGDLLLAQQTFDRLAEAKADRVRPVADGHDPRQASACADLIGAYEVALSLSEAGSAQALRVLILRSIHPVREASAVP